jgi:hypothetical protein
MALIFTKEPSGTYPAYNDSFIEFNSDISGALKAEINANPSSLFPNPFSIFPDSNGVFIFNLKEIVKTVLNQQGFKDFNFFNNAFSGSISGLYLLQSVSIEVFNEDGSSELIIKEYEFFKSVKQVEESVFENPFQLLSKSDNGIDFYLTYFEGFPFHFDIQRVQYALGKEIVLKQKGTSIESNPFSPTATGAFRINIDLSDGENFTSENILPLIDGLNHIEIIEDGEFRTNLFLKKKKPCDGIYLKWWNGQGGFSYWLFDEFYKQRVKGKNIGLVGANEFNNVGTLNNNFLSIGKTGERTFLLKTKADEKESEILRSLFVSPFIQIYSSQKANVKGRFFNIEIEETYEYNNKKGFNEFSLTIDLPEMITARL